MTTKTAESLRGRVDGAPRCPRCPTNALQKIGAVNACVKCGGVFVPASERDAMADALKDMADTAQLVAQHAPRPVSASQAAADVRCPVCLEAMQRFRIDGDGVPGGDVIEVDSCVAHGAFYDKGELAAVQRAFAVGAPVSAAPPAAAPSTDTSPSLELAREPRSQRHVPQMPRTHDEQPASLNLGVGGGEDERRARAQVDAMRDRLRKLERAARRDPKGDSTGDRLSRLALRNELRDRESALGLGFVGDSLISADTSAEGLILSELASVPVDIVRGIFGVLDILWVFKR